MPAFRAGLKLKADMSEDMSSKGKRALSKGEGPSVPYENLPGSSLAAIMSVEAKSRKHGDCQGEKVMPPDLIG